MRPLNLLGRRISTEKGLCLLQALKHIVGHISNVLLYCLHYYYIYLYYYIVNLYIAYFFVLLYCIILHLFVLYYVCIIILYYIVFYCIILLYCFIDVLLYCKMFYYIFQLAKKKNYTVMNSRK